MIVCVFEHVQWRFVLNDRLALGYPLPPARSAAALPLRSAPPPPALGAALRLLALHPGSALCDRRAALCTPPAVVPALRPPWCPLLTPPAVCSSWLAVVARHRGSPSLAHQNERTVRPAAPLYAFGFEVSDACERAPKDVVLMF
jgi:hypothetical protein